MESKIEKLCRFTSRYFKIDEARLYGKSKDNESVIARYFLWVYSHTECGTSSGQLAKMFYRDRRCIFRGINKGKILIKRSKCYREMYESFVSEFEKATP